MASDPVSLRVTVAGIDLESCIYNASGPLTETHQALLKIAASESAIVLSKSATLLSQSGNPLPRYSEVSLGEDACPGSINSEGLPNKGIDYYLDEQMSSSITEELKKPYFVSLSGKSLEDNLEMLDRATKCDNVSAIELNVACPNVIGKPIIGYDFEQFATVLEKVFAHPGSKKKPIGIKLPPYFDLPHFEKAAELLNKYPVKFVVSTNTIGNALVIDAEAEQPVIEPKGGFGGLGGGFIKYTALANVRQMRKLLKPTIDVIGAGGIKTGTDAFEFILCGATAVQVGTQHRIERAGVFARLKRELKEIMERKGYSTLEDFRGELRSHDKQRAKESRAKQKEKMEQRKTQEALNRGDVKVYAASDDSANTWIAIILLAIIVFLVLDKFKYFDVAY
mmetsp:Transcript_12776/g.14739  ORF Transcript_12776/g.14739 Transcript_12776/m.14739 type:complete len:394 (-) Transcript_12776:54-1235(-)